MNKKVRKNLTITMVALFMFVIWTLMIMLIDRKAIGPNGIVAG